MLLSRVGATLTVDVHAGGRRDVNSDVSTHTHKKQTRTHVYFVIRHAGVHIKPRLTSLLAHFNETH